MVAVIQLGLIAVRSSRLSQSTLFRPPGQVPRLRFRSRVTFVCTHFWIVKHVDASAMTGQDVLDVSGQHSPRCGMIRAFWQGLGNYSADLERIRRPVSTKRRQYVTAVDAAKLLGKSDRTIRRWIDEGKIKARHAAHNRYEIALDDLEALVEMQEGKEYVNPVDQLRTLSQQVEILTRDIETLKGQMTRVLSERSTSATPGG